MQNEPNPSQNPQQPQKTPTPRRRRRRWPKIVIGLLVLLVLLVVLLPTLASLGPVRSFVLGKVNEQINGKVEIDSWSVGWFSQTSVTGIKVYDENQQLILSVPRVKLGLTLMDAVRQNFAMGDDNVVDVESFVMKIDDAGKSNLERLPRKASGPRPAAKPGESSAVPNISGTFTVNFRGTVESETGQFAAVHVRDSSALVKITDINQPITSDVKIAYQQGEGQLSKLETSGTVAAIRNNLLNLDQLAAAQKVSLSNVNLGALEPILKKLGIDARIAGIVKGDLDVKAEGLTGLSTSGEIVVTGLSLTGDVMSGDTFQTAHISIPVNITRTATSGGDSLIKFENVGLKMNQATVAITGQVTEKSLLNLTQNRAPGADGSVALTVNVTDLKDIATQLKNTLKLQEGVSITGGSAQEQLTVTLTRDNIRIAQDLRIAATGTRGAQRLELKPITVAASATAIHNGKPIPDVRDIKLNVSSAFATITGGGDSLAKLAITGNVALNTLSTELSQFVNMQGVQLQGAGDFAINTSGDLSSDTAPIQVMTKANFQNVKVLGLADRQIDQDRLAISGEATIKREDKVPVMIDPVWVTVSSGDANAPLLDIDANAVVNLKDKTVPWFQLKKGTVTSLARLQEQYGGLVPALAEQKLRIESGSLYAVAEGSFNGATIDFSKPAGVSIPALTLSKDGRRILDREVVRASLRGKLSMKDGMSGEFTDLSVTTESKLLTLAKGGQGPLTFAMIIRGNESALRGNGEMILSADLKRLADLAQAFGGSVTVSPDQPQIRGGALNGTITLAKGSQPQTDLTFNGQITGLTIANAAGNIAQNEQLAINLTANAPDDLNAGPITADAKVTGSFINATVSDAKVGMTGSTMDMLRSATLDAQITDLAKAHALASAAGAGGGPTTGPALAPLQVTGGSAAFKMNVTRDIASKTTNLAVTEARITRLGLKRGAKIFAFDPNTPITAKLNAIVKGSEKPESIEVKELNADARIATLSMPEPITITGLGSDRPVYKGAIAAKGRLQDATPLLAVLQGAEPMPYEGAYDLSQKLSTRPNDGVVTLAGAVDVSEFRVMNAGRPAFQEPQVSVRNDLDLDPNGKKLAIKVLTLSMPQSQALALSFTGGVNDWDKARQIRPNTKLDVTYDLEKVWTIVRPMLSAEQQVTYKDLKVAGKYQKSFALTGAFPEGPIDKSFAALNAEGSLAVDLLDTMGLNIQKLQPSIKMTRGRVEITSPAAVLNEGALDLSGIVIEMARPSPELTVARNKRLIRNAKVNPVLANSLGMYASVIFAENEQASGLLDVTVIECQQVPVSALMTQSDKARAKIVYSIRDLQINGPVPGGLADFLKLGTRGLVGEIPESTVTLEGGRVTSNLTFAIARAGRDGRGQQVVHQLPLKFNGAIGLNDLALHGYDVAIPKDLIPDREIFGFDLAKIRQVMPPELKVPITGKLPKVQIDYERALTANLGQFIPGLGGSGQGGQDPLRNLGGILDQLQGGNRQQNPADPQPPRNRGQ